MSNHPLCTPDQSGAYNNPILICKRGVVAAYHVVWECVVERWLGVRRILSNKSLLLLLIPLQGKVPKEIHAILTETLACFLPGRAKDISASLYSFLRVN